MQLVVHYLTQAAIKLPSVGDNTDTNAFNIRCNLSVTVLDG